MVTLKFPYSNYLISLVQIDPDMPISMMTLNVRGLNTNEKAEIILLIFVLKARPN